LIHDIRSKYDFSKYYLNPLRTSPRPDPPAARTTLTQRHTQRREVQWGRNERRERERQRRAADELEREIEKRKWIYRHHLYAKVGAIILAYIIAWSLIIYCPFHSTLLLTHTPATNHFPHRFNLPPPPTLLVARRYSSAENYGCGRH
jgi:hypothetical protein